MNDINGSSRRLLAINDIDTVNDAIDLLFIEQHISGSARSRRAASWRGSGRMRP